MSLRMLEDVLAAARTSGVFDRIIVATNCKEGILVASKMGAKHFETFVDSGLNSDAVSYTHLTLPTILLV